MKQTSRFFVKLFDRMPTGELILANVIELPSEELAIFVAKTGAMDRVGTVALAVSVGEQAEVAILRSYGALPAKAVVIADLLSQAA